MKIKKYKSWKEAIEDITEESESYDFRRHTLKPWGEIKLHYHPKAKEFLVIDNGIFWIEIEREHQVLKSEDQVMVIEIPKEQKHRLLAISSVSYFVLRDQEDETIYCEN